MAREIFTRYFDKGLRPENIGFVHRILSRPLVEKGGKDIPFLRNTGGSKEEPIEQGFFDFPNGAVRLEVKYLRGNPNLVAQYALMGNKDFCESDGGLADHIKKSLIEKEEGFEIVRDVVSKPYIPCAT